VGCATDSTSLVLFIVNMVSTMFPRVRSRRHG